MKVSRLWKRLRVCDVVCNRIIENRVKQLAVADGALRTCNVQIANIEGTHVSGHVNHDRLPFPVAPLCVINVIRAMHLDKVSAQVRVQLIGGRP